MQEMPGMQIFGANFIFPEKTISALCSQSSTYSTASDIQIYGFNRLDIKERLFNVIYEVVSHAPPPKRR